MGKQIALHALTRDVGPSDASVRTDLVDLVEEHDARLLRTLDRLALNRIEID